MSSEPMIDPTQILPDVWVFYDEKEQFSYGAVLGDTTAILIDPSAPGGQRPLQGFVEKQGREATVVIVIGGSESGVTVAHPEGVALPVPGWALISLPGPNRLAVHNAKERALFCGDLLSDVRVPSVPHGSQEYLDCLDSIEKLDAKLIVPARGAIVQGKRDINQRLERDRTYIYALRRHVQTSRNAGVNLDRARQVARSVYEDYPFLAQHLDNIGYLWNEQ